MHRHRSGFTTPALSATHLWGRGAALIWEEEEEEEDNFAPAQ